MLRKTRITLAVLFFLAVTALFLDPTGTAQHWLGWTAKAQLLPALLATNVVVLAVLAVLTLLLGRVYCSVICPLGVTQDIISWAGSRRHRMKYRFTYSPARHWLRYGMLVLLAAGLLTGTGALVMLLAPYGHYGRIISGLQAPLCRLAGMSPGNPSDSSSLAEDALTGGLPGLIIAIVTFVIIATLAWRGGRTYCNSICPVGTLLGMLSRYSLLRPVINTSKCSGCQLCARRCKASCIDIKSQRIDYSRCVACMDCLDTCRHDAMHLRLRKSAKRQTATAEGEQHTPVTNRRSALTLMGAIAVAPVVLGQESKRDNGHEDKPSSNRSHMRATPILPADSLSARHLSQHCVGCQLCVSACPGHVLRPSLAAGTLMQPRLTYEHGHCDPECTRCSQVCPTGAIRPINVEEKSSTRIGHAEWVRRGCLPLHDGTPCAECARHCPQGAILMAPADPSDPASPLTPHIDAVRCIGCGACEHACPAQPQKAIYVEGNAVHTRY